MAEITEDEFIAWKHHPVTTVFMGVLSKHIQEIEQAWMTESWHKGKCSPERLAELRGRARGIEEVVTLNFKDIKENLKTTESA